jgi:hypothetical protein
VFSATVPLAIAALGMWAPMSADPDDQAAADQAVAVFNERLTDAGWTSTGPPEEFESSLADESEFGDCFNGFDIYLENTELRVDDETARAYADEFTLLDAETGSTSPVAASPFTSALVITVDESAVETLDSFVAQLGAADTIECLAEQPAYVETGEDEMSIESVFSNEADLGVGDASAQLEGSVSMHSEDSDFPYDYSYAFGFAAARTGRSLVVVFYGTPGTDETDFDAVAELEAMADSLN